MEIVKDYNKCNLMLGGDNKCKKNKKETHIIKWKKMHSINKQNKYTILENNLNNKKQPDLEIWKLPINKTMHSNSTRK